MNLIDTLRQYRIGVFSMFDIAAAYIGFWILAPLVKRLFRRFRVDLSTRSILWLVLPLSVVVHLALGLHTALVDIVLDPSGHWIAKAVIVLMVILGLRGVHRIR